MSRGFYALIRRKEYQDKKQGNQDNLGTPRRIMNLPWLDVYLGKIEVITRMGYFGAAAHDSGEGTCRDDDKLTRIPRYSIPTTPDCV